VSKVTVNQTESLNPANPFSAQSIVSNDGPIGINDVSAVCTVTSAKYKERPNWRIENNVLTGDKGSQFFKQRLEVGERGTLTCPFNQMFDPELPVIETDISITVNFRPDYTWWHPDRAQRFVTKSDSNGVLHWFPEPIPSK
jgi:hypothetical protein